MKPRRTELPVSRGLMLAGDVGASNTRLALCRGRKVLRQQRYENATKRFSRLDDVIEAFTADSGVWPEVAIFGCAGPVDGNQTVRLTNASWPPIDAAALSVALGIPVEVLNDAELSAYGLLMSPSMVSLRHGNRDDTATKLSVSWGTGIGDALLFRKHGIWVALPSEIGAAPFAPRTDDEQDLLNFVRASTPDRYTSFERVLSGGQGFANVLKWVMTRKGVLPLETTLAGLRTSAPNSSGPSIAAAAINSADPACVMTLQTIGGALGSYLGARAAATSANGGVYLSGGLAEDPQLLTYLIEGTALIQRFAEQGMRSKSVESIPIMRVCSNDLAFLGAMEYLSQTQAIARSASSVSAPKTFCRTHGIESEVTQGDNPVILS